MDAAASRQDERQDEGRNAPAPPLDHGGPVARAFRPMDDAALERAPFALFADRARETPDAPAVADEATRLTYGALHALARALAGEVCARVPRGTPVAVALPNGALAPAAILALLACGRPGVMLDLESPAARLADILAHSGAAAIVVDRASAALLAQVAPDLPRIDMEALAASGPGNEAAPSDLAPTGADEVAVIVYTSGSTGRPKGVAHRGRLLNRAAQNEINAFHLDAGDRVLQLFAPAVYRSFQDTLAALFAGAALDMVDLKRQGLQALARAASERGATILNTLPQVLRRLASLDHPAGTFASVRIVALGGDRVFGSDVALFRRAFPRDAFLYLHLGASEADKYAHVFIGADTGVPEGVLPAGHLLPGMTVRLEDEAGHAVPEGAPGAVVLESCYLAHSYWRDSARTAAAFRPAPDGSGRVRFRIGDLARFEGGVLHYLGRDDRMVKVRGNRVDLTEVESAIRSHPDVMETAVIARRLEGDAAVIAYVVPRSADGLDPAGLEAFVAERLPPAMRPAEIHLRARLPALPNQKLDLLALEAEDRALAAAPPAPLDAPEGEAGAGGPEGAARAAWTRLLGAEAWTRGLPWQEAGGDSLKAMELVMRLERALGRPVPVSVLLPHSTPQDLVRALAAADGAAPAGMVLFLLPGAAGPIMGQAAYARALQGEIDLRILDYPAIDPESPRIVPLAETAEHVLAQISAQDPGGALRIAGYSYGGYLALEVAARLAAQGREIAFLALIDTPAPPGGGEKTAGTAATDRHLAARFAEVNASIGMKKRVLNALARGYMAGAYALVRHGWMKPLSRAIGLLDKTGHARARMFLWWHVTHMARRASVLDHAPKPYGGRIFLLRVRDEPGLPTQEDYGWRRHCPDVSVAYVDGLHDTVFAAVNVTSLDRALRAALAEAARPG